MRTYDWSSSSLGPPVHWPQSLRTVVRLMLNTGHPMYIWWGSDLACLYNDAYAESIGPERHPQSLGRPAREVWSEIWDVIGPQIEHVMAGKGATWHVNHLVPITRHGRREDVYWTYSYSPIDDETAPGGIGGTLVICTETTKQVQMSQNLALERDKLAQLFAQAPSFMALLRGAEHRFEIANPAYLQLIENRPVVGKTLAEALPEAVEQGYADLLDQVFKSGTAFSAHGAEFSFEDASSATKRKRFVDFVYQPIKDDASGKVTGIFVLGSDVTERTTSEVALRDNEARLRSLADKLSAMNRNKDEFMATLAHELRNPLAPIVNAVQLFKAAPDDPGVQRAAKEVIERQVEQMVRLVNELIDVSRVSRGIVDLRRSRTSLADVIRNAVETSKPLIDERRHSLTVILPPSDVTLDADRTRLIQVFANLLNNAAKFTPPEGRIELVAEASDPDGIVVRVRDNGVGIPKEMLERVFEMFGQLKPTSAVEHGGGLGIGLTLVRRLLELHGGAIEASSEGVGKGSEFVARLPRSR